MIKKQTHNIERLILVAILGFAFVMAFIPHFGYKYPLHVDEWNDYAHSQSIIETHNTLIPNPLEDSEFKQDSFEIGFATFLANFKIISGLQWNEIFSFLPSFLFTLAVLAAFAFGKKMNFGLEAAFLVSLIPTTVRILGPSFLVPVSLCIIFIPLVFMILHNLEISKQSIITLFVILCFVFLAHPPTGIALSMIVGIYALFFLYDRRNIRTGWLQPLILLGIIPCSSLIVILRYQALSSHDITYMVRADHNPFPLVFDALAKFGYIPVACFLLGIFFLVFKGKTKEYALLSSVALVAISLAMFTKFSLGIPILYDRGWIYLFITAGLVGGCGLKEARITCQSYVAKYRNVLSSSVTITVLLLMLSAAYLSFNSHYQEKYYQIMDDQTYNELIWIRDNLPGSYEKIALDPWVALAAPPITGKHIFTYSAFFPTEERITKLNELTIFFENECEDTKWLQDNKIDIIYTKSKVNNPNLKEVHNGVYILNK